MTKPTIKICLKNVWEKARHIANQRHEQKKNYKSCKIFNDNYFLLGVLGEMTFSLITQFQMDTVLRVAGDNGYDFPNVSIKTTQVDKEPWLVEYMDKNQDFNGVYVLIGVDLVEQYGFIIGTIRSENFKIKRKVKDFGWGDRFALHGSKLTPYLAPAKPLVLNNIYENENAA